MHGLGNDFVILDARGVAWAMSPALARAIGDRHIGVGYDQLALVRADPEETAALEFWNADGSEAAACGNATRCVASLLFAETGARRVTLRTAAGRLTCDALLDGAVSADMGPALFGWEDVPLAEAVDTVSLPLDGAPGAVSIGNPHCVFFVDDAEVVALTEIGPRMEHHPLFPKRTNVEICQVLTTSRLRMRVWERGGMITRACGSGACAAVVAGVRKGLLERTVDVELDGGVLHIHWREDGHVVMTGPVAHVFDGVLSADFLAEAGR
ncbi:MAG: diaminopimelate epimerase [Pseudomonadota bacterium]